MNITLRGRRNSGQTIIIDIDDFFSGLPEYNIAFHTTDPKKNELWNRQHMLNSYRYADAITTSTQFLYDYYKKDNPNTYLVKNAVNPDLFLYRYDVAANKPKIGWVGIMLWRAGDIRRIKGLVRSISRKA
jgi:hypothetical protein